MLQYHEQVSVPYTKECTRTRETNIGVLVANSVLSFMLTRCNTGTCPRTVQDPHNISASLPRKSMRSVCRSEHVRARALACAATSRPSLCC